MIALQTIAFFSQKGGSGKTTLAIHAAVAAQETGQRVVLIDCDPQESAARWGVSRDQDTPFVAKANPSDISKALSLAQSEGFTLAILDCPPHMTAGEAQLVATADYVIIPCQPTALDIAATAAAVTVVQAARKPFAFVINRAPYRAPENREAQEMLAVQGAVCPVLIGERRAFARALTGGKAVTEFESSGKGALEIRALWQWITQEMQQWQRGKRQRA
jgi:chromosome partitioning protein